MNRNSSSSSSSSFGRSPSSSSSSRGPIRSTIPVVPLRVVYNNESILVNDIPSMLTEKDVEYLYDHYQNSQETFGVYAPTPHVRVDDWIPAKNTIIVYEEQLKVGLRFLMDLFYVEVLHFHKLAVTQLHPNSWRIFVAFCFLYFNNNIEVLCYSPNCTS